MKSLLVFSIVFFSGLTFAKPGKLARAAERAWVQMFLKADEAAMQVVSARECAEYPTCAEISIEKSGYVYSDCKKIGNDAQDRCAVAAIQRSGYVYSDCLELNSGGQCALLSIEKSGYVYSDCLKIKSYRQDRCAVASIKRSGYVYSDCLAL